MKNLKNSVRLIGHLGKDPEVRVFESGTKKVSFSLATNDSYKNDKGEKVIDTQWHNLVMWGKLADIAEKYLKKGNEIAVEGRLIHREYEASAGETKHITEINVGELLMLGANK
jgi:single-strand DNA-binding protein